jgi:hypothetical protein
MEPLQQVLNRLAGTSLLLSDFQDIYKSQDPEDFVREVLDRRALPADPGLSQAELVEVVKRAMAGGEEADFYLGLFESACKHSAGINLIYWPSLVPELPRDREPTAEEIADLAVRGDD